jgi:hypothetical protein
MYCRKLWLDNIIQDLDDDGKIYTGQVTFTASKPIEVEVIHIYRPDPPPDEIHGEPPTALIMARL